MESKTRCASHISCSTPGWPWTSWWKSARAFRWVVAKTNSRDRVRVLRAPGANLYFGLKLCDSDLEHYGWCRHASNGASRIDTKLVSILLAPLNYQSIKKTLVASTAGIRGSQSTVDKEGFPIIQNKRKVRPATGTNTGRRLTSVPPPPWSRALFVSWPNATTTVYDIIEMLSTVVITYVRTKLPFRHEI